MSEARKRLKQLRGLMARHNLDAYFVPSTDPHQSEYVPSCWQRRQWLSGFTGSAGDLLVTPGSAGLWTDGRYHLQASRELKGSGIKLFKDGLPGVVTLFEFLGQSLGPGQVLGADPQVLSRATAQSLEQALGRAGARLKLLQTNLVDAIWPDRPLPSRAPLWVLPARITGESTALRLRRLRKEMARYRAEAHVLSSLDAIAWLLNIRSTDVEHNPVAIAYAIITSDRALLFCDPDKVTPAARRALGAQVEVRPYLEAGRALAALGRERRRVWVDSQTVNLWVMRNLGRAGLIVEPSPIHRAKARKNPTEIAGIRAALLQDGVAMVRFLCWLEEAVARGGVTELGAAARLADLRAQGEGYQGESFETIVGYTEHGAIIHYAATKQSDAALRPEGLLLVDSGGQYTDGTTDITRTVLLGGEPTAEQRDRFTRVLKGHVAIARCRFPAGTAGRQIDVLARKALWDAGLNYNHGTGHGVGFFLSVHEGPQAISPTRCTGVPLEEGNILSNEPGFYKEGEYGIRIENLVLVVKDRELGSEQAPFLGFETLTLCPIDSKLVDRSLLSLKERQWLEDYHRLVRGTLQGHLGETEKRWLDRATGPL